MGVVVKKLPEYNYLLNRKETLFFLSFAIFLCYLIFNTSFYAIYLDKTWKVMVVVCVTLLLCGEVDNTIATSQDIAWGGVALVLTMFFLITAMGLNGNSVAIGIIYIYCARDIPFEKIARFAFWVSTICICIIVISAKAGFIMNHIEFGARNRQYLGFRYSLYGPALVSNITAMWIYIRKKKITFIECFTFVLVNYWFFYYTNSRLSFGLTILLIIVAFLMRSRKISEMLSSRIVCIAMALSFVFFAVFSIVLTVKYDPNSQWMYSVNMTLGNRLSLGKEAIISNGIHLFPNANMELIGSGLDLYGVKDTGVYNYVDCFYLQLLLKYGILTFLATMTAITYAMHKSYKNGDILFLVIMTCIAVRCTTDDLYMYINYNTFWLALGYYIKRRPCTTDNFNE